MLVIKRKIIISLFKQCLLGLFVYKIAINITVDFILAGVLLGCGSFAGEERLGNTFTHIWSKTRMRSPIKHTGNQTQSTNRLLREHNIYIPKTLKQKCYLYIHLKNERMECFLNVPITNEKNILISIK